MQATAGKREASEIHTTSAQLGSPIDERIGQQPRIEQESPIDKREQLRREIERNRDELEGAVLDLRQAVEGGLERIDVRRRIVDDPMPWLVGGFFVGLMLGMRR